MKTILAIALLALSTSVNADCNPVTFEGCSCSPSTPEACNVERPQEPTEIQPAPPIINLGSGPITTIQDPAPRAFLFASHLDAEGNYFHMLEGLAILTIEIQKRIPDFQGFPLSIFLDRQYQDCREASSQIYSQDEALPYIGVCFVFANQAEAESNYSFGVTTYYQYWDLLQKLLKAEAQTSCSSAGLFRDGAFTGNLWKPVADPKARCKNGTTVLLAEKYKGIDQLDLLDKSCNKVASAQYFGLLDNKRPRFCFFFENEKGDVVSAAQRFGNDSVFLSFSSELKKVENASNRED